MNDENDLPVGEADEPSVPEMDESEALRIFRTTEFLHRSVKK